MPVNAENLNSLIQEAWEDALKLSQNADFSECSRKGDIHKELSNIWIDSLGKQFRKHYKSENDRVFWRGNPQEILFDLSVCEISTVESVTHEKPLPFVVRCHWQIESEFDQKDSGEIVLDMSKLVMGLGENKLFVASYKGTIHKGKTWETRVLEMCKKTAKCCDGKLFFCFIAHPKDWEEKSLPSPSIYRWINGGWEEQLPCGIRVDSPLGHALKGALHSNPSSGTSPARQQ